MVQEKWKDKDLEGDARAIDRLSHRKIKQNSGQLIREAEDRMR